MDPEMIMTIIISLLILAVGVFAFYVTITAIPVTTPANGTGATNQTYWAVQNASQIGNNVFNIVGVVLVIGAIMTIVGLVYSYVKPGGGY